VGDIDLELVDVANIFKDTFKYKTIELIIVYNKDLDIAVFFEEIIPLREFELLGSDHVNELVFNLVVDLV
jgi:hypothetical protein